MGALILGVILGFVVYWIEWDLGYVFRNDTTMGKIISGVIWLFCGTLVGLFIGGLLQLVGFAFTPEYVVAETYKIEEIDTVAAETCYVLVGSERGSEFYSVKPEGLEPKILYKNYTFKQEVKDVTQAKLLVKEATFKSKIASFLFYNLRADQYEIYYPEGTLKYNY